jgi:hypothetical protein
MLAVTRNAAPVPKDACTASAKLHSRRRIIYVKYVGFQHVGALGQWYVFLQGLRACGRAGGGECVCPLVSGARNQESSYAKLITPNPNRDDVAFSFRVT